MYDVFAVTQENSTESEIEEKLNHHSETENAVLFVRKCVKDSKSDTYIVCINKEFGLKLIEDKTMVISKYHVNRETLEWGQTWGFHIKCNQETETYIEQTFANFESNGFIHQGTYQLKKPKDQEGNRKNYVIITFQKKDDRYPKQFIRKLKGLIDYKSYNDEIIKINWIRYNTNRQPQEQLQLQPQVQLQPQAVVSN